VPYRGEAPALADMLGGQVQVIFGTMPGTIEYIRSGSLHPPKPIPALEPDGE
jgi:tripartite-type tricarboxylate transporter receptor subunit TctC